MIFIFGFRTRSAVLATLSLACRNGHVAAHRIVKITRWFTLFFIPVIPFSRKYRSVCIQCGLILEVPKEAAEELASRVGPGPSPSFEPIAPPLPAAGPGAATTPTAYTSGATAPTSGATAPTSALPPAGWYPDPAGAHARRYWDGQRWTEMLEQL